MTSVRPRAAARRRGGLGGAGALIPVGACSAPDFCSSSRQQLVLCNAGSGGSCMPFMPEGPVHTGMLLEGIM